VKMKSLSKPAHYDRNLVVIGAGSAGLVSAYIAATVKARVTLIEEDRMGGDCLNTGCVPSKALIRTARFLSQARSAGELGLRQVSVDYDFADIMERVQRVITAVAPHDSIERYTALGVECIRGRARITSPWSVQVDDRTITTRSIIVAAGAGPYIPDIPGMAKAGCLTSDSVWGLRTLPRRLVVLGGGPIGCELAQCFARFGSRVTQVEMLPRLLMREDPDISALVQERFQQEGVRVLTGFRAREIRQKNGAKVLSCERDGEETTVEFDELLVAAGRTANTRGYGLEEVGVALNGDGTIATNRYMQTSCPSIFACGDVTGPYQFTHVASHQAWYAAVNALFGSLKKFRVDYSVIPWATFTEPEIARVGLNEIEAGEKGIEYEVTRYGLEELDRAIADGATCGMVKILTVPGKDRILGATIAGEHAGDLITEYVSAMRHGLGMNKILGTIHIYPTLAEANKYAAGEWRKAHAPTGLLKLMERFHRWRRG
jgi:pyruvate/2-oxoglutarate dehydrogenase complex dihydrolipoamide dehydrogenase (E3) component